ncbi:MAG: GntR family transcriptional regulator [Acidobacteria bacterium]|nr:GntR family transcriptional regulator [Acidobacteriota bacterium]MBI3278800.1 GntR family transcriptional regulator [Acidobacteriota bacterium]
MKKLKIPSNLTSLAYDNIKRYILEGKLDEGARLTEEFLATTLGISKSPIREALNRLETEGLIRIEPRRGAYLKDFSTKDVNGLYGLREALETHVVRTAKLSAELISGLNQSVRRMRKFLKDNDRANYIDEDMRFHASLATAADNEHLYKTLENVQNRIWIFRRKTYDLSSSTAPAFHEAIIAALEAGDRKRAERAMSEHIDTVRRKLLDFLEQAQHTAPPSPRNAALRAAEPDDAAVVSPRRVNDKRSTASITRGTLSASSQLR